MVVNPRNEDSSGFQILTAGSVFSLGALQPVAVGTQFYLLLQSSVPRGNSAISRMIKLGHNMNVFTRGAREHVRLGSKFSKIVKGKLSLDTRIVQVGGVEKVFKQKFDIRDYDEKLVKVSLCYLPTTACPISGLLFISIKRVAFCSDRSIKAISPMGHC